MPIFNVGDRIMSLPGNPGHYSHTQGRAIMVVTQVGDSSGLLANMIQVDVVEPHSGDRTIGRELGGYWVNIDFFTFEGTDSVPPPLPTSDIHSLPRRNFRPAIGWVQPQSDVFDSMSESRACEVEYAILNRNGNGSFISGQPCHGRMKQGWDSGVKYIRSAIYPSVRAEVSYELQRWYYRWLLQVSPYRFCIMNKSVKDIQENGLLVRTDVPANYLLGTLIASRYTWSHYEVVLLMRELVKKGVEKNLAFVASHLFRTVYDDSSKIEGYRQHNPHDETLAIQVGYVNQEFVENFSSATLKNPEADYEQRRSYQNVFGLWSGVGTTWHYEPELDDDFAGAMALVHDREYRVRTWSGDYEVEQASSIKEVVKAINLLIQEGEYET